MSLVRSIRSFPLSVRLLLVNQCGVNTGFYLLVPYLAMHLSGDLGLSAAVVGVVLGVRNLSQQGLFLIGGSASDRLGARGVIIAGCALRFVGFGLFAIGDTVPLLLAASVLSGLAGALFNPAVRAYIAVAAADRRAEAFALFNVSAQTGALLGPLLGSALLLFADFRVVAVTAAVIFAVLTVAQALVLPRHEVEKSTTTVLGDWRECLANRPFLLFTLALTGLFALQTQLYLVLPLQADRLTGWAGAVAAMFLVSTIASLLLQVRITRWAQARMTRGRAMTIGMAVMGLGFLAPLPLALLAGPATAGSWMEVAVRMAPLLVTVLALEIGVMLAQPFVLELIPEFGRGCLTGTYFGLFYLVSGLVAAVGNGVLGWAADLGATGWPALPLCAALGVGSALAVWTLHRRGMLLPSPAGGAR
jgi:hypothetical protein